MEENKVNAEEVDKVENQDQKEHLDFLTGIVLFIISVAGIIASICYWQEQGKVFYTSAGFMPIVICSVLAVLSVFLFVSSLKNGSAKEQIKKLGISAKKTFNSKLARRSLIGLTLLGVYVFFLLPKLEFVVSSLIILVVSLIFAKGEKTLWGNVKLIIIGGVAIGLIYLLFKVAFRVPLP